MNQSGFKVKQTQKQSTSALQHSIVGSEHSLQEALNSKNYNVNIKRQKQLIVGCRIPRKFFWTSGIGESDITIHAGSYHLALKEAGIERFNIMVYSSIMPAVAQESTKPVVDEIAHGSVMETISAVRSGKKGERLTAGIVYGWLYHKLTGKKYGGLVCEYNGNDREEDAKASLKASLNELYTNGFSEEYDMRDIRMQTKSFVPKKKFGTVMVVIGFKDYLYPIIQE